MPRQPRARSESGYYHVMFQGNGKQTVFPTDAAKRRLLAVALEAQDTHPLSLHAYCLMGNHAHLVVHDEHGNLAPFMHRLQTIYAGWFNSTTKRVGHVFRDRFASKPIETDAYLITAIRYVHSNPEEAGICRADRYPWSSYQEYATGRGTMCDVESILGIFGSEAGFAKASEGFDISRHAHGWKPAGFAVDDAMAHRIAEAQLGRAPRRAFRMLDDQDQEAALARLKDAGLTRSQIMKTTGASEWRIRSALHGRGPQSPRRPRPRPSRTA